METRSCSRVASFRASAAAILALALVATACSGPSAEDGETSVEPTAASSGLSLGDVSIDSSSIEELDVIRFSGIDRDGDLGGLALQGITQSLEPMDMLLFLDDAGLYTIFPLHPENPGSGGDIVLRLSAGEQNFKDFDVEIRGLPAAPGAWGRAVDAMIEGLESRADQLGTSLEEIAHTAMTDLDNRAAIIKLVAGYVDDGSTNDLESLLVRPGEEFSADEVDLIDSIVEKIGLEQLVLPSSDMDNPQAFAPYAETVTAPTGDQDFNAVRAVFAQSNSCWENHIQIAGGDELADALKMGLDAREALNDPLYRDVGDVVSGTAAAAGVIAVVGVATGVLAAPALTVAAGLGAVSTMYTTDKLVREVDAGSYPTMFVTLDAAVDKPTFNEDYTERGNITGVKVTASSTGFNATDELASIAAALVGGATGFGTGIAAGEKGAAERLPGVVNAAMGTHGMLQDSAIAGAIKEGRGLLEFCAKRWIVDIKDEEFVEVLAVNKNVKVDSSSWTYEPEKVGDDILRFETKASVFHGVYAIADVAVETKKLGVVAEPAKIQVKRAGDPVDITATLENADTWDLAWEKTQGTWLDGLGDATEFRVTQRQLETPTDKNLYPFTVTMTSLSKTGLREGATDKRTAKVTITLRDLIVAPDPGRVRTKGELLFTATDLDGVTREVTWMATGGTIGESSGVYTAGKTPGTYSVTATAVDDPSVVETVSVSIHDGECVIGSWLLRSDEFFSEIGQTMEQQVSYRSGENRLIVREDGTYTAIRDEWSYAIETPDGNVVGIISAEDGGTWLTTETHLFFDDAGGGDVNVGLYMEVGGKLVPFPFNVGSTQVPAEPVSGEYLYLCEDDVFSVLTGGITSVFDRVDG